jgi:hypothetical protein
VELRNASVGLRDLWGGAAAVLCEQLVAASSAAARFALLESALLARAARPLARHPAVAHGIGRLGSAAGAVTVAAVTEKTGLSRRRAAAARHVLVAPDACCGGALSRAVRLPSSSKDGRCALGGSHPVGQHGILWWRPGQERSGL